MTSIKHILEHDADLLPRPRLHRALTRLKRKLVNGERPAGGTCWLAFGGWGKEGGAAV